MGDTIIIETPVATVLEVSGLQGPQGPTGASQADVLTAQGDLLYRGASAAARLAIGTAGQVLKVNSGATAPEWAAETIAVPTSRTISAGTGLTGGGDLSANRTLAVTYGTTAGTACQGNDSRLSDARTPTAHTHLAADVTDLSLNKVPEARQTYNITSTNSAFPTEADALEVQNLNGSIDCVIVLNNTTGIVYADIVVPNLLNRPGSQRGRVVVETQVSGAGDFTNFRINVEGTIVYGYDEIQPTERLVFVWTGNSWNLETIHTATQPKRINLPSFAGTLALTSDITKSAVGLGNVTNNAQVTSVSGTAPIVSSGGTTPAISISAASTSAAGSMSAADKTKLDGIAASANNYTHPNHTGDVTSVGDGATTIAANAVTNAKLAQIATSTIKGRATSGTGNVEDLSSAQVLTILGLLGAIKDMKIVSPSSDVTATSSTTLSNVTGMSFTVAANTTYLILTNLQVNCGAGGYDCQLSFPSILNNGTTASGFGIQLSGSNSVAGLSTITATTVRVSNRGTSQTTPSFSILLVRTDSTGGTANFQWAQNTSSAAASTISATSRALIVPLTT